MSAWTDALTAAREEEGPVLVSVVCAGQHARGVRRDAVVAVVRRTSYGPLLEARHPIPGAAAADREMLTEDGRRITGDPGYRHPHVRPDEVRAGLTLVLLEVPEAGRMVTVSASRLEVGDDLEAYAAARQPFRDEVARLAARYAETRRDPDTTPEQLLSASRAVRAATEADRAHRARFARRETCEAPIPGERGSAVGRCPDHGRIALDEDALREAYARARSGKPQRILVFP